MKQKTDQATVTPFRTHEAAMAPVPAEVEYISSKQLFAEGRRNLLIQHESSTYRLTLTRQNKLILTK